MPWWLTLILFVGFTVLGELLRPKPKFDDPEPSSLGDFQLPTADGSRPIPVIFGTCLVRGPNVVWYGDLLADPIVQKVKTGWFSSEEIVIGYKYFLGMQLALCHGTVHEFRSVRFNDLTVNCSTGVVSDWLRLTCDDEDLFGGEDGEGGVSGSIDLHWGTANQARDTYLEAVVSADIPAYRQVCYATFRKLYVGNSPHIKDVAFEISRFPNEVGLAGGMEIINSDDANPACMLYDLLTDPVWGIEIPTSQIDLASFQAAGATLYAEGMGMSAVWDRQVDGKKYVEDILRHIDGTTFTDPVTGLETLALARDDYDPGTLPVYGQSEISEVNFQRGSWSEIVNTVRVRFISRADNYTPRIAQQMNLAAVQVRGDRAVVTMDFLGLTDEVAANRQAARVLNTLSYPLAGLEVVGNRKLYQVRPGSVFKLDWAPLGISELICRVNRPRYGELTDGRIRIDCVEDIFAISPDAFSPPASSGWVDPIGNPVAALAEQLIEGPYHVVGGGVRFAMAMAVRASGADLGYQIWSDPAGGTAYEQTNIARAFTPSGLLTAGYAKTTAAVDAVGFTVDGGVDLEALATVTQAEFEAGVNLLMIGDEIMAFRDVTDNGDGTFDLEQVMRGVLDTVPEAHSNNDRVWFIWPPGLAPVEQTDPYPADLTVTAKLLPYNQRGALPIASASQLSLTTASRALLPYPPGKVQVDSVTWPTTAGPGDIVLSWAHRHRVDQLAGQAVVSQDAGDYSASPEGDYTIEVRVNTVLQRTVPGETGTSWTWTAAMQTADGAGSTDTIEFRLIPVSGALVGTYQVREFTLA